MGSRFVTNVHAYSSPSSGVRTDTQAFEQLDRLSFWFQAERSSSCWCSECFPSSGKFRSIDNNDVIRSYKFVYFLPDLLRFLSNECFGSCWTNGHGDHGTNIRPNAEATIQIITPVSAIDTSSRGTISTSIASHQRFALGLLHRLTRIARSACMRPVSAIRSPIHIFNGLAEHELHLCLLARPQCDAGQRCRHHEPHSMAKERRRHPHKTFER